MQELKVLRDRLGELKYVEERLLREVVTTRRKLQRLRKFKCSLKRYGRVLAAQAELDKSRDELSLCRREISTYSRTISRLEPLTERALKRALPSLMVLIVGEMEMGFAEGSSHLVEDLLRLRSV